jgi:hypothetical protein
VDSVVRDAERSGMPAAVFTAGDNAYPNGTLTELQDCFGASWGRFPEIRRLLRPAPGDHDYGVRGAAGYFAYFGRAAGPPGKGWYTYRLGQWRIIVLNSAPEAIAANGPQLRWLRALLAADHEHCTLAYWHAPRFSSGVHGGYPDVGAFWTQLYSAGAELVISGDDHDYERFAPQTPLGTQDPRHGVRQFVVGTGGAVLRGFAARRAEPAFLYHAPSLAQTSERRIAGQYGVLRLVHEPGSYRWEFIDARGRVEDAGSDACHARP